RRARGRLPGDSGDMGDSSAHPYGIQGTQYLDVRARPCLRRKAARRRGRPGRSRPVRSDFTAHREHEAHQSGDRGRNVSGAGNFARKARAARMRGRSAGLDIRFREGPKKLRGKVRERKNRKAKLGTLTRGFSLRGGALGLTFLLGALFLFCGSGAAQTVPHVTGTFKTAGNQTPLAAGLRSIATIGATVVYGSVDFQPYDSTGNKPTRILCGGVTYIPQKVRAWIKGDGTLVDNATGAAGVDLVPTQGCTPAGLVMRATITLAPSGDGRIASVTWT